MYLEAEVPHAWEGAGDAKDVVRGGEVQGLQPVHRVRVQQHGGQHARVELHLRHGTGKKGGKRGEEVNGLNDRA